MRRRRSAWSGGRRWCVMGKTRAIGSPRRRMTNSPSVATNSASWPRLARISRMLSSFTSASRCAAILADAAHAVASYRATGAADGETPPSRHAQLRPCSHQAAGKTLGTGAGGRGVTDRHIFSAMHRAEGRKPQPSHHSEIKIAQQQSPIRQCRKRIICGFQAIARPASSASSDHSAAYQHAPGRYS